MSKSTIILFGFTLGLLSTQGQATTYYLDSNSGSDWNAGASLTSPKQSLRGASAILYHPGDQILLKAGSVWKGETLHITTSDESDLPITIGSYGVGKQPVLDGNSSSSPVKLSDAHYVTVENLTIENSNSGLVIVEGGYSDTVRNCTLVNGGVFAVHVSDSPGFTFADNTYESTGSFCTCGDVLRADTQVSGITIYGNKITLNYASRGTSGIYILDVDNANIYSNTITGGSQAIGVKGYTHSVTGASVHGNTVYYTDSSEGDGESIEFTGHNGSSLRVSGSIYGNTIYGGSNTINAIACYQATNVQAYDNKVNGPLLDAAFHWTMYSSGGVIHNNTISGSVPNPFVVLSGSSAKIYSNTVN